MVTKQDTRNATSTKVLNEHGEKLDVVIEGNKNSKTTIIFVHGLGADKEENFNLFVDLSRPLLEKYQVLRFDLSGCGKSEGREEDSSCRKHSRDLNSIIDYTKQELRTSAYIVAHSMGAFVVSMLSPENIGRTAFITVPGSDTLKSIEALQNRIRSRPGGIVDENKTSIYPRSNGDVQKIGPDFWRSLKEFNPLAAMETELAKTDLIVFGALQDDVVDPKSVIEYKHIEGLRYVDLQGNHNFTKAKDRDVLISKINEFFGVL